MKNFDYTYINEKKIPLGNKDATLRFFTAVGNEATHLKSHINSLKSIASKDKFINSEIYGSANLNTSAFSNIGQTFFIGTKEENFYQGIQAYAVSGLDVKEVVLNGQKIGAYYEDDFACYALLGGLLPRDESAERDVQTLDIFAQMDEALQSVGLNFSHVGRTWFYNNKILDWYDVFNRERDKFFISQNVFENLVPASTGVGSLNKKNAALMARVFAVKPKDSRVKFEIVNSPMQCPAPDYRSSFSRAVELNHPYYRHLLVSGTASIDQGGSTAHVGDIDKQVELTFDVVEAILKSRQMNWADATRAVAYIKDFTHAKNFLEISAKRGLESLPWIWVQSDVCRDDLLFEIELDAIVKK